MTHHLATSQHAQMILVVAFDCFRENPVSILAVFQQGNPVSDHTPEQNAPADFDKAANTGFTHFKNATRFSTNGLTMARRNAAACRQALGLFVISIPLAICLGNSPLDWAALIGVGLIVLIVGLLNPGIEACVDRIGTKRHPLSRLAEDFGSVAVMLALTLAYMVWAAQWLIGGGDRAIIPLTHCRDS